MDYIKKISELVKEKKITKREFAKRIGKNENTIANYFSRKTKLDVDTLIQIAKILDVSVSVFFEDNEKITRPNNNKKSTFSESEFEFITVLKSQGLDFTEFYSVNLTIGFIALSLGDIKNHYINGILATIIKENNLDLKEIRPQDIKLAINKSNRRIELIKKTGEFLIEIKDYLIDKHEYFLNELDVLHLFEDEKSLLNK